MFGSFNANPREARASSEIFTAVMTNIHPLCNAEAMSSGKKL
jgi:hypothetical protein